MKYRVIFSIQFTQGLRKNLVETRGFNCNSYEIATTRVKDLNGIILRKGQQDEYRVINPRVVNL